MDYPGLRSRAWRGALLAAFFVAGFSHAPAAAQTSIVALVNNTPITSTEVAERRAIYRLTKKKEITARQALDQIIDMQLMTTEATRRGVKVSDVEVDQRFAAVAQSTGLGSVEKLSAALVQAGASARAFKADIRHNLLQRKVVSALTRAATGISEKEIAAGITAKRSEGEGAAYKYTMQQIVFVAPKGASPAQINQRKSEAENLRRRIQDCDQGVTLAKSLRDVAIKPPVVRLSAQLPSGFRDEIGALKIGQSTKPEANDLGVEIIVLCDKTETMDDTALRNEVQGELMKEQGQAEIDKFMADLRKRALIIYK